MKLKIYFKLEDFWLGAYYDKDNRVLYLQMIPCIGLKVELKKKEKYSDPNWRMHATNQGCCG